MQFCILIKSLSGCWFWRRYHCLFRLLYEEQKCIQNGRNGTGGGEVRQNAGRGGTHETVWACCQNGARQDVGNSDPLKQTKTPPDNTARGQIAPQHVSILRRIGQQLARHRRIKQLKRQSGQRQARQGCGGCADGLNLCLLCKFELKTETNV